MARISRTGTTDSTGVASTTVTGTGGGRLKFISRNGGLWSNSKEILDAIFVDSSDCTVHPYNNNTTAEWIDNYWKVTMQGVTGTYFDIIHTDRGVYGHYVPLNTVKGQTVTVEFDYKTTSNQVRSIAYYDDGTGWRQLESAIDLEDTNDEWVHFKRSYTFSSEATRVWVRLQNKSSSVAVTFSIKDLVVYPTFTAPKHYTPIALSSSASIIQTGETATLTAELTNVLGEKLASKSVNFIEKVEHSYETINTGDNVISLSLPSKFTIEFDLEVVGSSSTSNAFIRFNSSSGQYCGKGSSSSNNITFFGTTLEQISGKTTYTIEYDNGKAVCSSPNNTITVNNLTLTSLYSLSRNGGTVLSNVKIYYDDIIGTGTTNSQGIATCNNTITGTGKGERQFIASNSSILSETYSLWDYIFYDTGVDGTKNTNWENSSNRLTIVTDNTGTTLTGNASSNGYYFANASDKFIFDEYVCEFIVVGTPSSSIRWYHQNTSNSNENVFTFNTGWFNQTENLVQISVENGVATLIVNGTERRTTTLTVTNPYEIGFRIATGTSNTVTYKDFKVYPV